MISAFRSVKLARLVRISLLLALFGTACMAKGVEPRPTERVLGEPVDHPAEVVEPAAQCLPTQLGPTGSRLLTRFEYDNTVRDLLGDTSRPAARLFPPENEVLGFDNFIEDHRANPFLVLQYQVAAEEIAAGLDLAELLPCTDRTEACGHQFVDAFVPRAFRGDAEPAELALFRTLFSEMMDTYDFATGIRLVVEAVLQSPQFLYRLEPSPPEGAREPVTPLELASRLSYLFWGSMPDDQLLAAARGGELDTPSQIEAQARRLLEDPRARPAVVRFYMKWLHAEGLPDIVKDEVPNLGGAWRDSLTRFIEHAVFEVGTFEALMTGPELFLDDALAPHYADPGPRAGLLTQPALLALLANPNQSSPIQRGVYVRERILCLPLRDPPPDIDVTPPDPDPSLTTRQRFAIHTENAACAGCHLEIDPIGFGFEQYDALGRFRTEENGHPVDASGAVYNGRDPQLEGPFDGAVELARKIARSERAQRCLVQQQFRYAVGRLETEEDLCALENIEYAMRNRGGDLLEMLVALTQTDTFQYKRAGGGT